jgi:N4-gp56 family major capsid protein
MIDGEEHYVLLMNPFQAYDLRTASGTNTWSDYQKAMATAVGNKSPIFKGGLGMINNVVLHMHKAVVRFSDYGAGSNVAAARSLFMGVQAGAIAFGSPGTGMRFDWHEEMDDRGNQLVVDSGCIWGFKKCQFAINSVGTDFGVISVDTAAADPG